MIGIIFREPLVHLIIMGIALFGIYDLLNPETENKTSVTQSSVPSLEVTSDQVIQMLDNHDPNEQRPLSKSRKKELIESYLEQEILYKEAYRLGLNHDALVRDRLIQKTQFYLEGQFVPPEPSEEALKRFYHEHAERYRQGASINFEQRLLKNEHLFQVQELLKQSLVEQELLRKVEPLLEVSLLSLSFQNAKVDDLDPIFGPGFFEQLKPLPLNKWIGTIKSMYGSHLVKITQRHYMGAEMGAETYEQARRKVKSDWIIYQRQLWMRQQMKSLRQDYGLSAEDFLEDD